MLEIKNNPQVYTTQEGAKNWIHTNLYQETALCLDSFFWPKVEASTVKKNLKKHIIIILNFFQNVYWLLLTDILAISHDFCSGGISRLKCTVESDLIYRINNWIIFWDPTNPSAGILPVQLVWHRDQLKI